MEICIVQWTAVLQGMGYQSKELEYTEKRTILFWRGSTVRNILKFEKLCISFWNSGDLCSLSDIIYYYIFNFLMKPISVAILGAGISGLTFAAQLSKMPQIKFKIF